MILLGLSQTPKNVDPAFFDVVTDNLQDIHYDFLIDMTGVKLLRDPHEYLSEVDGIYGDFIDQDGILRLSTTFPYKYNAYPGMIVRKSVFERHGGDINKILEEPLLFRYIPEALVRILPFS